MNKDLYDPYKIMISGYLILIWHYSPFNSMRLNSTYSFEMKYD